MRRRNLKHRNHLCWDAGLVTIDVRGDPRSAVVVVEHDERRFFPVPRAIPWEEVFVTALEHRFRAVGWWGIPRRLRVEGPEFLELVRQSELLDDCEIVVLDALVSMRWARLALHKMLSGERDFLEEYVRAA